MSSYFIKLPNSLVWNIDTTLSLSYDMDKLVYTMCYLDTNINRLGLCCFTLEDLILSCDMKVRTGKGNSIEQFKDVLLYLQSLSFLDSTLDIKNIKPKDFICCNYNVTFAKDKNNKDTQFFRLYYNNFFAIIHSNSKLDKFITLKVYCYILARIIRNNKDTKQANDKYGTFDDSVVECFYDNYGNICRDLNISKNTYLDNINLLSELGLIYYDNIGLVKDDFGTHTANNIYAESVKELKRGLACSKKYYEDNNYTVVDKKCSKESKVAKGKKGRLKQQNKLCS